MGVADDASGFFRAVRWSPAAVALDVPFGGNSEAHAVNASGWIVGDVDEGDGAVTLIKAQAPLSTVMAYHRDLKSQTAGEGSFSMRFVRYAQVPANAQPKVLATYGRKHEEE